MSTRDRGQCVNCGYCCRKAPCWLGAVRYGATAPCPGLVQRGKRFLCGLLLSAETEYAREGIVAELSIGGGCCSSLNSDRRAILRGATP